MRLPTRRGAAAVVTLLFCLTVLTALPGCLLFHKGGQAVGCREPKFTRDTASEPPLVIPQGMTAPDTHNAVHIPPLSTPEPVRPQSAPCLPFPPSFAVPETHGPPVRSTVPLPPPPGVPPVPAGAP